VRTDAFETSAFACFAIPADVATTLAARRRADRDHTSRAGPADTLDPFRFHPVR
jgi:hypothetical protein